ncbi:DUF6286 domain-containing protein [Streptomyces sp. NPDC004327]|uniref:DUF6286 domain-containing protein n=1 Tax=unclassified Streptomyces TaxID=2593676 RepID=UPI00368A228D
MTEEREPQGEAGPGAGPPAPPHAHPPSGPASGSPADPAAPDGVPVLADGAAGPVRRFWSVRRIPAAVLAVVLLGGAGLLLYDVAAVRAGHTAMAWRRSLAQDLATRPLDDTWVLAGASVAVVLGIWLLLLALTPGLRAVLPMRRRHPDVRAGLDREAAALALRDRAIEVSGVQSVRVKAGRAKVAVRAVSHFRELDEVRADLEAVLATGVDELALARPPAVTVRVARPPRKR